jgi:hypothetical protein
MAAISAFAQDGTGVAGMTGLGWTGFDAAAGAGRLELREAMRRNLQV